jgi:integrase
MATVFRRKLTRYVLDGLRVRKGTPGCQTVTSRSRDWYGYVGGRYVRLSPVRDVAVHLVAKRIQESEERRTSPFAFHRQTPLSEHVQTFREHLEAGGRSERYVRETIQRLEVVTAHCTKLEHVTADRIDACLNDLAKLRRSDRRKIADLTAKGEHDQAATERDNSIGASAATRNSYLAAAKSFCGWCVRTRRLPENPLAHASKLNEETDVRRDRRTLTADELGKLIATTEQSGDVFRRLAGADRAALYAFAGATGLRAGELASLSVGSLALDADPPIVTVAAAYSKRRRKDQQPLPTWLVERIREWLAGRRVAGDVKLWPGSWHRRAAEMLRVDLAAAGLAYCDVDGRPFDFHSFRHQFISSLSEADVHPRTAQQLARHSTIELTMKRYTHLSLSNIMGAVESIPEPTAPHDHQRQRATGTDDRVIESSRGDGRVTARVSKRGLKCTNMAHSTKRVADVADAGKSVASQRVSGAEGMGLEPTTGCPAPHFQCGR